MLFGIVTTPVFVSIVTPGAVPAIEKFQFLLPPVARTVPPVAVSELIVRPTP